MAFTELVLLYYHVPHVNNHYKTLVRDTKILTMFLYLVIKKYIDRLETKMTDGDPSIVGQHVQPLKNNYFKIWFFVTVIWHWKLVNLNLNQLSPIVLNRRLGKMGVLINWGVRNHLPAMDWSNLFTDHFFLTGRICWKFKNQILAIQ